MKDVTDQAEPGRVAGRDNGTRQQVIDAAIQSILERGFYRASSNAIAERAGLTWGVIQYHFGTREALMLAVLEDHTHRFSDYLRTADVTAESLPARVEEFFDILAAYYGTPEYLAFTQIAINLSHDPRTSERTLKVMSEVNEAANPELRRLLARVLAGTGLRRKDVRDLLFHSLRGLALSHLMLTVTPFLPDLQHGFASQRKLLAEGLSLIIEQQARSRT
jgi:AcrR family transcriptional regulator